MKKFVDSRNYPSVAAICYTAIVLYEIIFYSIYNFSITGDLAIIKWGVMLAMAAVLFIKNKKFFVITVGISALLSVYSIIRSYRFIDFGYFLVYAGVFILVILSINNNTINRRIWFVPACLLLLINLIVWFKSGQFRYYSTLAITFKLLDLFNFVESVALFFVGLWLKEVTASTETTSVLDSQTEYPVSTFNAIGEADKLKILNDLLDTGVLTQEEFEAKKKQLLGL